MGQKDTHEKHQTTLSGQTTLHQFQTTHSGQGFLISSNQSHAPQPQPQKKVRRFTQVWRCLRDFYL